MKSVSIDSSAMPVLSVTDLEYAPITNVVDFFKRKLSGTRLYPLVFPNKEPLFYDDSDLVLFALKNDNASLNKVTFQAKAREVTLILGESEAEISTLIDLICQRRLTGSYDGNIDLFCGDKSDNSSRYTDNIAHVIGGKIILIPGMSFEATLEYSIKLSLNTVTSNDEVLQRLSKLLELAGLSSIKSNKVPTLPITGFDDRTLLLQLRLLNLCCQLSSIPTVAVIEAPFDKLNRDQAILVMDFLRKFAKEFGVIVLCGCRNLPTSDLQFDRAVLISKGYSIFDDSPDKITSYFTSLTSENSYMPLSAVQLIQRVESERFEPEKHLTLAKRMVKALQEADSDLSSKSIHVANQSSTTGNVENNSGLIKSAFEPSRQIFFGLGEVDDPFCSRPYFQFLINFSRCFWSKLADIETIKVKLMTVFVPVVVVGYLQNNQGVFGRGAMAYYCMSLATFPYTKPLNITALFFLIALVTFFMQIADFPVFYAKIKLFRQEQLSNKSSAFAFTTALLIVETLFTAMYAALVATPFFFWTKTEFGIANYRYYYSVICLNSILGMLFVLLLTSVFRRSRLILNVFFFFITLFVLTGGYAFNVGDFDPEIGALKLAAVNPIRWAFEAFVSWKFVDQNYKDGAFFASFNFSIGGFTQNEYYVIFANFASVFGIWILLSLFAAPNWARRSKTLKDDRKDSTVSEFGNNLYTPPNPDARLSSLSIPSNRNSSVPEKDIPNGVISTNCSFSSESKEVVELRPSLIVDSLTLRNPGFVDKKLKYVNKLDGISLVFHERRLHLIISTENRGNNILRSISGDISLAQDIAGNIMFNEKYLNLTPYDSPGKNDGVTGRFSFVSKNHEMMENLTVFQLLFYAAKIGESDIDSDVLNENISIALNMLGLQGRECTHVSDLTISEYKLLCIAEQMLLTMKSGKIVLLLEEYFENVVSDTDQLFLLRTLQSLLNNSELAFTIIMSESKVNKHIITAANELILLNSNGKVVYNGGGLKDCVSYLNRCQAKSSTSSVSTNVDTINAIHSSVLNAESSENESGQLRHNIASHSLEDVLSSANPTEYIIDCLKYFRTHEHDIEIFYNSSSNKESTSTVISNYRSSIAIANSFVLEDGNPARNKSADSSHSRSSLMVEPSSLLAGKKSGQSPLKQQELDANHSFEDRGSLYHSNNGLTTRLYNFVLPKHLCKYGVLYWNLHLIYIFRREAADLTQQVHLMITGISMHVILALLFYMILGAIPFESGPDGLSSVFKTQSFFVMISFISLFLNLPFINYLYKARLVHVREHSRGLYSNFSLWWAGKIPYTIVKSCFIAVLAAISYSLLQLADGEKFGYWIGTSVLVSISSIGLLECILCLAPNVFTVYQLYYLTCLLYYLLCSLFINFQSLPRFIKPWSPSISPLRWVLQGNMIKQFEDEYVHSFNTTDIQAYIDPAVNQGGHVSTFFYSYYLALFGWGGKSTTFCLLAIVWLAIFFKLGAFVLSGLEFLLHKGGYRLKKNI